MRPVTVSGAGAGTAPMLYTPAVIAVLYDVHGNLAALDAVLEDARAAGARQWVLGGDYVLFGAWPAETVARLRELEPAVWIRGLDRHVIAEDGPGAAALVRPTYEDLFR